MEPTHLKKQMHLDDAAAVAQARGGDEEAFRVLKRGGRLLVLEFSEVELPLLDKFYDEWSFRAIPRFGKMITGDSEPYQYLVESIRKFPNQENFAAMIRTAGFSRVSYTNYTGGIAALHSGWKL